MRLLLGLMAVVIWLGALPKPGIAGDRPMVVVELFTSQGCSSCPPADAILAKLAQRDDVLALALHVDYWDYIGWADTFARPEHTLRQKAYSHIAGLRSVYTPQMIIAGTDHVIGSKPMEIAEYIEMFHERPARVSLVAVAEGNKMRLTAVSATHMPLPPEISAVLVRFTALERVTIEHGENAGSTIDYVNVVTSMNELGQWDGQGALTLEAPLTGDDPAAVFLQAKGPGEILGAVRIR